MRLLSVSTALCFLMLPLYATAQAPAIRPAAPSLGLPAIIARALAVNPSGRAAQQHLTEAQAKVGEAAAQRRLQMVFNGSVSGSHGQVAEPVSIETFGTMEGILTVPLPNAARLAAGSAQAQGGLHAAQAGVERARLDLAFRAADAYYGVLRARETRDIAQENLAQAERQVADTQKRVEAGDVPAADVLKAQVPEAQARATLAKAESDVASAERALNSLLVQDLGNVLNLAPAPAATPLVLTREQVSQLALAHSPDVLEAQANVASAEAALRAARHANDPEWSLQATHTRTTDPTAYASLTTVMAAVILPLSDGGVARQQIKQAQAQLDQARSALETAKQAARLDSEQAYLAVQAAQANVQATAETARIAAESLTKAQQSYAAGLTTTRDVLDAQLVLSQARTEASAAVYDLAVARARLDQAVGKEPLP